MTGTGFKNSFQMKEASQKNRNVSDKRHWLFGNYVMHIEENDSRFSSFKCIEMKTNVTFMYRTQPLEKTHLSMI